MDPDHLQAGQLQISVPRQPFPASLELAVHHVRFNTLGIQPSVQVHASFLLQLPFCEDPQCSGEPGWLVTRDTEQKSFDKPTEMWDFFGTQPQQNNPTLILGFSSLKKTRPFKGGPTHHSHIKKPKEN